MKKKKILLLLMVSLITPYLIDLGTVVSAQSSDSNDFNLHTENISNVTENATTEEQIKEFSNEIPENNSTESSNNDTLPTPDTEERKFSDLSAYDFSGWTPADSASSKFRR